MPRKYLLSYCFRLITMNLILGCLFAGFYYFSHRENSLQYWPVLLIIFSTVNFVFHLFLIQSFLKRPAVFFRSFLLLTVLKLLVYSSVIIIFILQINKGMTDFLISFLIIYLTFTIFEVFELIKISKKNIIN